MELAYWMYVGPAHIGTLRVASSFKNVHAIMHALLGDDHFNVMHSMLERERDFTLGSRRNLHPLLGDDHFNNKQYYY